MCPTCQSRLDLSHSPAADRIRAYVERRRDEGWTKQQVKDALVADFGPSVLAAPPAAGMGLVAWLVPGALVAGGLVVVIALTLVWRRRRAPAVAAERGSLDLPGITEQRWAATVELPRHHSRCSATLARRCCTGRCSKPSVSRRCSGRTFATNRRAAIEASPPAAVREARSPSVGGLRDQHGRHFGRRRHDL